MSDYIKETINKLKERVNQCIQMIEYNAQENKRYEKEIIHSQHTIIELEEFLKSKEAK